MSLYDVPPTPKVENDKRFKNSKIKDIENFKEIFRELRSNTETTVSEYYNNVIRESYIDRSKYDELSKRMYKNKSSYYAEMVLFQILLLVCTWLAVPQKYSTPLLVFHVLAILIFFAYRLK